MYECSNPPPTARQLALKHRLSKYETSIREDQDVTVLFKVQPAEPDVGLMSAYAEIYYVIDDATGAQLELTEDESDDLQVKAIENFEDDGPEYEYQDRENG